MIQDLLSLYVPSSQSSTFAVLCTKLSICLPGFHELSHVAKQPHMELMQETSGVVLIAKERCTLSLVLLVMVDVDFVISRTRGEQTDFSLFESGRRL